MRKLRSVCLVLLSIVNGSVLYAAEDLTMSTQQAKSLDIETAPIQKQGIAMGAGLPAQVVIPNQQMQMVSAPLAGFVESMSVTVNEEVKQGQVIARLNSPTLIEAQREFLQAATQAELRRENLKRDAQLFKEGIIAESRYRTTRNESTEASAELAEQQHLLPLYGMSEAAIRQLREQRTFTSAVEILSPLDGVVLEQLAVPGQRIEAAAPLYKLASLTPLWLDISVPLTQLAQVSEGSKITVPAYQATGKVLSIGRSVNSMNQTVLVRAEVVEAAERLRPGQQIEAEIAAPVSKGEQWVVPSQALVRQDDQVVLFVQTTTGFRVQPVSVVGTAASTSTIEGPFSGTEQIAVRGTVALKGAWQGLGGGEE